MFTKISRPILLVAALSPLAWARPAAAQTQIDGMVTPAISASGMGRQIDAQSVVLRVQPPVGARYRVKQFSRLEYTTPKNSDSPRGTTIEIVKATFDMEVTGRDDLGATAMKLTYRDFSTDISGSMFDQDAMSELKAHNPKLRALLVGQSFSLKVAPDGQLWNIISPNEVFGVYFSMPQHLLSPVAAVFMARRVNNKENPSGLGASAFLPAAALRVGDGWNIRVPNLRLGYSLTTLTGKRTLKGLRNGVALVTESGQISAGASELPSNISKINGTMTGTSRIEIATGLPLETNLTARAQGEPFLSANGERSPAFSAVFTDRIVIEPR